ncbi:MAG TPA: hypothetical protein DIW47_07295 [Bacteroidetes bacterium]|nr:hypothetical protein [Bacteroidota bacterium]
MKQLLLFLSLCGITNALPAQNNPVEYRPDHEAYNSIQGIYEKYIQTLNEQIVSGEIKVFDAKNLKKPVDVMEVQGMDWVGIRFDKKYLTILVTDDKTVYVKKGDLDKLEATSTLVLFYIQEKASLKWVTYQTIENNVYKVYDKLQERIYMGIMEGDLTVNRTDSLTVKMPVSTFDTAFDQERVEWDETIGDSLNYGNEEFTPERIIGTCRVEHSGILYGITYTPLNEPDQNFAPMCWILADNLKAFLDEEEWLFFEAIWL